MRKSKLRAEINKIVVACKTINDKDAIVLYSTLQTEHGKNCADHFVTVLDLKRLGGTQGEVSWAIDVLVRSHPPLKKRKEIQWALSSTGAAGAAICILGIEHFMNTSVINAFGSVGVIGIVLVATIYFAEKPLKKIAFSRLSKEQSGIAIIGLIAIFGAVAIIGAVGWLLLSLIAAFKSSAVP